MKSSSINALLSECEEMNLEYRRECLAKKCLIKYWGGISTSPGKDVTEIE